MKPSAKLLVRMLCLCALMLMLPTSAFAHHPEIAATVDCKGLVSFTSTAWEGSDPAHPNSAAQEQSRTHPKVEIRVNGTLVKTGAYNKANGYSFSGTYQLTAPFPASFKVSATTVGNWANGSGGGQVTETSSKSVPPCPDVCPNIAGNQSTVPPGMFIENGQCVQDKCPNIAGGQSQLPPGMYVDSKGNCVQDKCPNLDGGQSDTPPGMYVDANGNCVQDKCPNIDGGQSQTPPGMIVDGSGNCVTPPDVCANIDGVQTTVPAGMVPDGAGNCVVDQCPNIDGVQTTVPAGMTQVQGTCVVPGKARISSAMGCVKNRFFVKVSGTQIASVTFYVDGKKVMVDRAAPYRIQLNPQRYKKGVHHIRAVVNFKAESLTKARSLKTTFYRCVKPKPPTFTG